MSSSKKELPETKSSSVIKWIEPRKRNKVPPKWVARLKGPKDDHYIQLTKTLYRQRITCEIRINDESLYDINLFVTSVPKRKSPKFNPFFQNKEIDATPERDVAPLEFALEFADFKELGEAIDEARDYLAMIKI